VSKQERKEEDDEIECPLERTKKRKRIPEVFSRVSRGRILG